MEVIILSTIIIINIIIKIIKHTGKLKPVFENVSEKYAKINWNFQSRSGPKIKKNDLKNVQRKLVMNKNC